MVVPKGLGPCEDEGRTRDDGRSLFWAGQQEQVGMLGNTRPAPCSSMQAGTAGRSPGALPGEGSYEARDSDQTQPEASNPISCPQAERTPR